MNITQINELSKLNLNKDMIYNLKTIEYLNKQFDYVDNQSTDFYDKFFVNFIDLFLYCINNNKFITCVNFLQDNSRYPNDNKIYRGTTRDSVDFKNDGVLIPFENDPPTNPFFFGLSESTASRYFRYNNNALIMCRSLRSITADNTKIICFIKFYINDECLDVELIKYFYKICIQYWLNIHIINDENSIDTEFLIQNRNYNITPDKFITTTLRKIKESYGIDDDNRKGYRNSSSSIDIFFLNGIFRIISLLDFVISNLPISIINPLISDELQHDDTNADKNNIIILGYYNPKIMTANPKTEENGDILPNSKYFHSELTITQKYFNKENKGHQIFFPLLNTNIQNEQLIYDDYTTHTTHGSIMIGGRYQNDVKFNSLPIKRNIFDSLSEYKQDIKQREESKKKSIILDSTSDNLKLYNELFSYKHSDEIMSLTKYNEIINSKIYNILKNNDIFVKSNAKKLIDFNNNQYYKNKYIKYKNKYKLLQQKMSQEMS